VEQLLAQKERWHSNRVEVSGYYVCHFEESAIYASEADALSAADSRGLWVWPWKVGVAPAIEPGDRRWVRAVGVFRVPQRGGCGHFGQWPAELVQVELMEPQAREGRVQEGRSPEAAAQQAGGAAKAIASDAQPGATSQLMSLRVSSGELTLTVDMGTYEWRARAALTNGWFESELPWDEFRPGVGEVAARGEATLPVRTIKTVEAAGRPWSAKADDITWLALRSDQHPDISYRLTGLALKAGAAVEKQTGVELQAKGALAIGGVTNRLLTSLELERVEGKRFKAKAAFTLRLSDFKLTTPMTTGFGVPPDEVRVVLDWLLEPDGGHRK